MTHFVGLGIIGTMKGFMRRIERGVRVTLAGLVLAMLAEGSLAAQEITGSIRGTVFDPSGAGVPSAQVSAIRSAVDPVCTEVFVLIGGSCKSRTPGRQPHET